MESREEVIVKVSVRGIIMNVILVIFKAFVGIVSNSISVVLDAVNNLGDVLSQVVTVVGTKLSLKKPDKDHPYGHGRIEYLSSALVASILLLTGLSAIKESVSKIIHPEISQYSNIALLIIGVAVVVKFIFGLYAKKMGKAVSSESLIATGTDSFMDSILSLSTFIAAIISRNFGVNIESYLALVISFFILKAGFEIFKETLSNLIGSRIDSEFSINLKKKIREYDKVLGAYDLILHDYGPSRSIGSVHIEVDSAMTATEIHLLSKRIISDIYAEFGIVLTVGIYASNTDKKVLEMKEQVLQIAKKNEYFIQLHAFFVDEERKQISFDTVISHKAPSFSEIAKNMKEESEKLFEGYSVNGNIDYDFSD